MVGGFLPTTSNLEPFNFDLFLRQLVVPAKLEAHS